MSSSVSPELPIVNEALAVVEPEVARIAVRERLRVVGRQLFIALFSQHGATFDQVRSLEERLLEDSEQNPVQ